MTRLKNGKASLPWAGGRWLSPQKIGSLTLATILCLLVGALSTLSAPMFAAIAVPSHSTPIAPIPTATSTVLPPTAPPPPLMQVSKRVYLWRDSDGDEMVSPGDELLYAFAVTNRGGERVGAVVLRDALGPNLMLLPGTIATSRGQVVAGNAAGDMEAIIEFGDLEAGESVQAQLRVVVTVLAAGQVANQAVVSYRHPISGAEWFSLSDDPTTAEPDDPTVITVRPAGVVVYLPIVGRE